jgi:hypothetical protein
VLDTYTGVDPQWSVRLAFKWCEQPEWIHVNTTPLFSLVRDCGSMFGLALASPATTRYSIAVMFPFSSLFFFSTRLVFISTVSLLFFLYVPSLESSSGHLVSIFIFHASKVSLPVLHQFQFRFSSHHESPAATTVNACFSVRIRNQVHNNTVITVMCALFLMVAFHLAADAVPTSDVRVFYVCQFILHAVKPYLLFIGIPQVARLDKHKQH